MPVSIAQPQQFKQDSTLDKIAKGLDIAKNIYGLYAEVGEHGQKTEANDLTIAAQKQAQYNAEHGVLTKAEQLKGLESGHIKYVETNPENQVPGTFNDIINGTPTRFQAVPFEKEKTPEELDAVSAEADLRRAQAGYYKTAKTGMAADRSAQADEKYSISRGKELTAALDFSGPKSGQAGILQGQVNQAQHLKSLLDQYKDGNLPAAQTEELAIGLNRLISGSSAPAQAQIHALVPSSVTGDVKQFASYLFNEPLGTGQQAFVANIGDSIDRQLQVSENLLSKVQKSRLPQFQDFAQKKPELYRSILAGKGLDENGDPVSASATNLLGAGAPANAPAILQIGNKTVIGTADQVAQRANQIRLKQIKAKGIGQSSIFKAPGS